MTPFFRSAVLLSPVFLGNHPAVPIGRRRLCQSAPELLDQKPLGQLDDGEPRLMNLILSRIHVSLTVEMQTGQGG